jgi:ComF family protein
VHDRLAIVARTLLDHLFPPLCLLCRAEVGEAGALCAACWGQIRFVEGAHCISCGVPFDIPVQVGTRCAACHADPPAFDRARAVMRYDDASKGLLLAFKHADRLDLTPTLARWLERAGHELIRDADVIVPVPLHPRRLWSRRYNQAAELARALSLRCKKSYEPFLLVRKRATDSQGSMPSAKARKRNVEGAFGVPRSCKGRLAGKSVLLVDDVLTTGATLNACAVALKKAGAARVAVLALARVSRTS